MVLLGVPSVSLVLIGTVVWSSVSVRGAQFTKCSDEQHCWVECSFSDEECFPLPSLDDPSNGEVMGFVTSASTNQVWDPANTQWSDGQPGHSEYTVTIDTSSTFQTIRGFGAAVTDAANVNIEQAGSKVRSQIIDAYFSLERGSGFTVARVPMASCDFSPYSYTWAAEDGDFDLQSFQLDPTFDTGEFGKIAFLTLAGNLTASENGGTPNLRVFGSPWTAPPWMKVDTSSNDDGFIGGHLNPNRTYWQTYSEYFARFIQEYESQSDGAVKITAVTVQNEPFQDSKWESMVWNASEMGEFVADYLGPSLSKLALGTQIWIHDDQKELAPELVKNAVEYPGAAQYIDAVALHWYEFPPPVDGCSELLCNGAFGHVSDLRSYLDSMGMQDCDIVATEACTGFVTILSPPKRGPDLGYWQRGRQYAEDIIGDVNNGAQQWTDWNLAVDMQGGPNHVGNLCDAPILIDSDNGVWYKQPMYFLMAHISRLVRPGDVRVAHTVDGEGGHTLYVLTALSEDGTRTSLVILNSDNHQSHSLTIKDPRYGYFSVTLPPNSIVSYYWQ